MYDIFFDLDNLHNLVEKDNDDECLFDEYIQLDLNFEHDESPPTKKTFSPNGYNCTKCGDNYPYAEPNQTDGTLICYSCRSF